MKNRLRSATFLVLLFAVSLQGAQREPSLIELGTFGGSASAINAVSATGQVVGQSWTTDDVARAFSWTLAEGLVDIGTLTGDASAAATAVNARGQIVGISFGVNHAFLWAPGEGMIDLGTLGGDYVYSQALAINDAGQVVGDSWTNDGLGDHAFVWTPTTGMIDIDPDGATSRSSAQFISASGLVIGYKTDAAIPGSTAFSWTPAGGMQPIVGLSGTVASSFPAAINASGQVVGTSYLSLVPTPEGYLRYDAFIWTRAGGMVDLGSLGGDSVALGVNDAGQVVGYSYLSEVPGDYRYHAFIWTQTDGMVDLGTLGGALSTAADINAAGQVVGSSEGEDGIQRAFSWTQAEGMIALPGFNGGDSDAFFVADTGLIVGSAPLPDWSKFEPVAWLTCRNGGWRAYGVFKNQGDCRSYVATHGRNLPN